MNKKNENLTDEQFRTMVLDGVEVIETKQQKVLADVEGLSKETKKAMEEVTTVKNTVNDVVKTSQAMEKLTAQIKRDVRMSFDDPLKRFCASEENRNWLNAIARAMVWPSEVGKLPAHLKTALTGVDSGLGQAVIPTETASDVYDTLSTYGVWNTFAVRRPGARTNVLPVKTARPTYYWIGAGTGGSAEGTAITEGAYTGGSVSMSIQTLGVYLTVSREELADATNDVAAMVLADFAQTIAYGLDWAALTADGTADQTDAGYVGIFEAASVHTGLIATAADGNTTVGALDLADFIRCLTTVNANVLSRRARWWIHPHILAKICGIKDNNGRPIFQTALEAPAPGAIGSILGYPVILADAAPSTDSASAKVAVFGDPMGQTVGVRQDFEFAQSEHIKFAENMVAFRGLARAGVKMRVPTGNPSGCKPFAVLTLAAA